MKDIIYVLCCLVIVNSCAQEPMNHVAQIQEKQILTSKIDPEGKTISTRFFPPKSYFQKKTPKNSYRHYLQNLPLKPFGEYVTYFNGQKKTGNGVYISVIDLSIGKRDLHQCADAVMRLRAEFLWNEKRYSEIHFNFTNGFRVDYSEWMKGRRIIVKGNKTYWSNRNAPSNTYNDFWKYLEIIFSYAGTLSLEKELVHQPIDSLSIGDVFIQGGSPGHAIVVVNTARNEKGEKLFLLAQSYMPAQELQLLINPREKELSPWYSLRDLQRLETPEWTFNSTDLKRFE